MEEIGIAEDGFLMPKNLSFDQLDWNSSAELSKLVTLQEIGDASRHCIHHRSSPYLE